MSVAIENKVARLLPPSRVEDAEPLWRFLCAARDEKRQATVELSEAGQPHAAVLQLLLAFRPAIAGAFAEPFARRWLQPSLVPEQGAVPAPGMRK